MLTANGKALCKINNSPTKPNSMIVKAIDGNNVTIQNSGEYIYGALMSSLKLRVGSNTIPVTDMDYQFNNGNLNDLGLTVLQTTGTNDNSSPSYTQNYIAIFSRTFRNDTENDITVSEIGIIGQGDLESSTLIADRFILIARDVIDPVTIAPGEAYTFTMYIG